MPSMLDWIRTITLSRGGEESMLNAGTDARKSPALFFMCGRGEQSGLEAVLVRLDMSYRSVLNCIQFLQASDGVCLPFDY